jgi:para-aminobenzoate synthetase component I
MNPKHDQNIKVNSTFTVCDLQLPLDDVLRSLLNLDAERLVSILDSNGARAPDAQYLIAGFDPFEIIEARGADLTLIETKSGREQTVSGNVLDLLDMRLADFHRSYDANSAHLPSTGACIATFAYDLAWQLEKSLRRASENSMRATNQNIEPDAVLCFYDTLVIHDYLSGETRIIGDRAKTMRDELEVLSKNASDIDSDETLCQSSQKRARVVSNFTREEYLSAAERIREHIFAGDIYQANLTQQFTCELPPETTPEKIFLRLREHHPASFAAFIRRRNDTVVSQSPERFLRVSFDDRGQRTVEAWPIKGTRPRGKTPEEDESLRHELYASEKDRAENVMIVDLLRNDLGRVCRYGSIEVPALWRVQEHPTMFHLVSEVRGTLRDEITAGDLLRATFPSGSITGAPKLRAMEIIDEIENAPRGLSMGAIGYFSFDRRIDLNVAIRTMTVNDDGRARFNTGGGIVADSSPEEEYRESLTKARALLNALEADFDADEESTDKLR